MTRRSWLSALLLISTFFGMSAPVFSQGNGSYNTGTRALKGVVKDKQGQPVSGAAVLVKNAKTLQVRSFVTQEDGAYRFYGLSANDEYEVRAQLESRSSDTKVLSAFDDRKEATIDLKLK